MSNMLESYGQPEGLPGKEDIPPSLNEVDFDSIFAETPLPSPEDLEEGRARKAASEAGFAEFDKRTFVPGKKESREEQIKKLRDEIRNTHGNA